MIYFTKALRPSLIVTPLHHEDLKRGNGASGRFV